MKRLLSAAFFLSISTLAAQQSSAPNLGMVMPDGAISATLRQVNGRVLCGDTDAPGRFAVVQLIPTRGETSDGATSGSSTAIKSKALSATAGSMLNGPGLSTISGMDGTFSLNNIPAGSYLVMATLDGYQSPLTRLSFRDRMRADEMTMKALEGSAQKIVVQPNLPVHVELRLERGASLSGNIRYDDGSAAPAVTAILMSQQKDGTWKDMTTLTTRVVSTDDQGRFRFSGSPAGKYAVRAALPTVRAVMGFGQSLATVMNTGDALVVYSGGVMREREIKPVEVGRGDSVDGVELVFPLSGLHTVSGSVVVKDDGHAVNSGRVYLLESETRKEMREAMVDSEGNFRLNYVPEGQYIVKVSGAGDAHLAQVHSGSEIGELGRVVGVKNLKTYRDAEVPLIVKDDPPNLTIQVSEHSASVAGISGRE